MNQYLLKEKQTVKMSKSLAKIFKKQNASENRKLILSVENFN